MRQDAASEQRTSTEASDAESWRKSVREHETDRYRLAAQASTTLLLTMVALAAAVIFGGAGVVGWAIGRDRLVTPLFIVASVALVVGAAVALRYRKDAAAFRAHEKAYPGLWDEVESRLKT